MCGIFGVQYKDGDTLPDQLSLQKIGESMFHRGPDNTGQYIDKGIGLVHTRLSLLDLSERSNQPFWDESGRYVIVYNGEIYNYQELSKNLVERGVELTTTSDTEVLLYYLIRDGIESLCLFEGMFAFGLYDVQENKLLLGRDRFGIKPLFYIQDEDSFVFSSEQNQLTAWKKCDVDMLTISAYLQGFSGPHTGNSFYRNVKILPTGSTLEIVNGSSCEPRRYFSHSDYWDTSYHEELLGMGDDKVVDLADELLSSSVDKHLLADAKVGALCSGGVDSSLVLAMAARNHKDLAIFHSDVKGKHSEKAAALALAEHLGLDLQVVEVRDQDFIDDIARVTFHYGQPFAYHPNSVPFLKVTDLVKSNGVKAILTGEGADECFLGYAYLPSEEIIQRCRGLLNKLKITCSAIPFLDRIAAPAGSLDNDFVVDMFSRFEEAEELINIEKTLTAKGNSNFSKKDLKTLRLLGFHLRSLLHRNDCLGMSSSIEARFPFLDHEVVRFAVNLPYKYKIRFEPGNTSDIRHPFFANKWVVRRVADRYLPKTLSQRPKRGFPTDAFERMKINPAYFESSFVRDLFELNMPQIQYLTENISRSFMMRLLLLDVWGRVCLSHEDQSTISARLQAHLQLNSS